MTQFDIVTSAIILSCLLITRGRSSIVLLAAINTAVIHLADLLPVSYETFDLIYLGHYTILLMLIATLHYNEQYQFNKKLLVVYFVLIAISGYQSMVLIFDPTGAALELSTEFDYISTVIEVVLACFGTLHFPTLLARY